ncbi:MAG: ABC transporter permease [Anaerolineales bacterium]
MKNIWIVIKHEIITMVTKPSFWLTTFLLPAVIMGFSFGAQLIGQRMIPEEDEIISGESERALAIGYVDHAGIITALPASIPAEMVAAYPDEEAAATALRAGDIGQYYVIAEDYIASGEIVAMEKEFSLLGNLPQLALLELIVNYNLIGDETIARRVATPIPNLQTQALRPASEISESMDARFIVAYGTLFIFFFVFTMSSGFMLQSVSREKENRTVEILLVSLEPKELMLGKVLGLGFVALLQVAIWLGGSLLTLSRGETMLSGLGIVLGNITLPEGFLVWALLYFVLGYLLYASALGAIGALAPNARETGQVTFVVLLPLMIPLWLNTSFTQAPNGPLTTALSLFPLTAPTSMLPRLAVGGVPLWQPIASLIGLAITTYIFVALSARFFRADTLLSSASLDWKRLLQEVKKVL